METAFYCLLWCPVFLTDSALSKFSDVFAFPSNSTVEGMGHAFFLYPDQSHPGWMCSLKNEWQSPVWIHAETELQTIDNPLCVVPFCPAN